MTMSRHHAKTLAAILRPRGDLLDLVAPTPGLFRTPLHTGDSIRPDALLGQIEVLGSLSFVIAPPGARGAIVDDLALASRASAAPRMDRDLSRAAVSHGTVLFTIDPRATAGTADTTAAASTNDATGLVFRAPTSGRFYGRAAPDKPPFVGVGSELAAGATICLLEVMKTFHRVTYGGPGLPERARVAQLLVVDGADVNAGDPLLALDAV